MGSEFWCCEWCGHHILDSWDNVLLMYRHLSSHLERAREELRRG